MGSQRTKKTRRASVKGAGAVTRRVAVEFPKALLADADAAASGLAMNRSNFIRVAVARSVEVLRQQRLEGELAAAYTANAELDREICREFAHVDGEAL